MDNELKPFGWRGRKIAADAGSESRSLARYLAGRRMYGATRARIEAALRRNGFGHLVRRGDASGASPDAVRATG